MRILWSIAVLGSVCLLGCSGDNDVERGTQRLFEGIAHGFLGDQSSSEEVLVPVQGQLNVEVHNFAGDVIIRGDRIERTSDARVIFDRRGTHRGPRDKESASSLPEIKWNTELVPPTAPDLAPTLRITATTDHNEPWYQRLEIEVLAGELGRVTVVTTRGRVQVSNNRGPVDINSSKGDVRLITAWPQKEESIIVTSDGDIDFRVRGESAFVLDAETVGGKIQTRCESGRWTAVDARNDHDSMLATLNSGEARLVLRTVDGDIRVAVTGDPHQVGSFASPP